jgi:molybdenum cofactor guanylyltransferase
MVRVSGVLLAGGGSRRMGFDKAAAFGPRAAAVLAEVCDDVVVASGDGQRLAWLGLPQVADAVADAGPLGGLVAGLEAARHDPVAVLAVDMPDASPAVLCRLAEAWTGEPAVIPVVDGRVQPLHAVWSKTAATELRARLAEGQRSVTDAARAVGARLVGEDVWGPADAGFARNVNAPDDL